MFITEFFKALFAKKQAPSTPSKSKSSYPQSIICPFCGWQGTIEESLKINGENDTCPKCGETELIYTI